MRRFEVKQSIKDEPLHSDPETDEPIRRVISGGVDLHVPGKASVPARSHGCGPSCGCH